MRVLIVEDNTFNSFCLTRLLEAVCKQVDVMVAHNSHGALTYLMQNKIDLAILDGDLGAGNGLHCNGPALADLIWLNNLTLPIIAWSDTETKRLAFGEVFKQYNKVFNEYTCWTKVVSQERIRQAFAYLSLQDFNEHFTNVSSQSFTNVNSYIQ